MRYRPLIAALLLAACSPQGEPREELPDPGASQDAMAAVAAALAEPIRRIEALADQADRILSPLPVMTPAQEEQLRRYLNDAHVQRARALGVRATDRATLERLVQEGTYIELEDSTEHWIVRPRTAPAYVLPHTRTLLAELGARFQRRLAAEGLPAYRLEVTSATRSTDRQAALTESNANAAALSSHEFGTTVDVSYAAFAPPADLGGLLAGVPAPLTPLMARYAQLALESVSARKSREIGRYLAEVLIQAQNEGLVLVIYERQQTVFHLTVAREMASG